MKKQSMKEYNFNALILPSHIGKGGAYIEFPYDVEKEFGVKGRVPVVADFDGFGYRGSLVKMGTASHILGVLKEIRKQTGKDIGDMISVTIQKDEGERTVQVHPLLQAELDRDPMLAEKYGKLSFTIRKEFQRQLKEAKTAETRRRRLERFMAGLGK